MQYTCCMIRTSGGTVKSHDATWVSEASDMRINEHISLNFQSLYSKHLSVTNCFLDLCYCNPVRNHEPQTKNLFPTTKLCGDNFLSKSKHTLPGPMGLWKSDNADSPTSKVYNLKATAEGKLKPK